MNNKPIYKKWWFWVIAVVIVSYLFGGNGKGCVKVNGGQVMCPCDFKSDEEWDEFKDNAIKAGYYLDPVIFENDFDPCEGKRK